MRCIVVIGLVMVVVVMLVVLVVGRQSGCDRRRNEGERDRVAVVVVVMPMIVLVVIRVMIVMVMRMIVMVVIAMIMTAMTIIVVTMSFVGAFALFARLGAGLSVTRLAFTAGLGGGGLRLLARPAAGVAFFFLALVAFLLRDQSFAVGDGDLIVVGVNFTEGQEPVTVPAVIDESGLQ